MLAVDENGESVDGDEIMSICANHMKERGELKKNTLVVTVMSNLGLSIMGKEKDINIEVTKVGDRYVLEKMKEDGYNIGGEQSGHIIFLDKNTTGDGMMSALHLLQVMVDTKKSLSELKSIMQVLPQALVNAKVPNDKKNSYREFPEIVSRIEALEQKFDGAGRVLIRPSGTEPLVRVMIEGKVQEEIQKDAEDLANFIEQTMN
jgi:phosphoglucosamine mutase